MQVRVAGSHEGAERAEWIPACTAMTSEAEPRSPRRLSPRLSEVACHQLDESLKLEWFHQPGCMLIVGRDAAFTVSGQKGVEDRALLQLVGDREAAFTGQVHVQ